MTSTATLISRFRSALGGQLLIGLLGVLFVVVLANVLGANQYGLLFLALSIITVFETFSKLGLAQSGARYISEYKESDPTQLTHIVRSTILINSATIFVTVGFIAVFHRTIASYLNEPALIPLLLIGSIYLAFKTQTTLLRYIFQGFESIGTAISLKVIRKGVTTLLAIVFVVLGYGALGALIGYVAGAVISTLVGAILLYSYRDWTVKAPLETGLRRRIFEYSIPVTATSTMANFDKHVDKILIGFFINPAAVGFYTIGKQVVTFIEKPMSAAGFTLSPTFSAEKAKGNRGRAREIYENTLIISLVLYIPAAAGLALIADPLVELVFGAGYLDAIPILQVLSVYAIFVAILKITSHSLDFLGRARIRAYIRSFSAVLNLILNILLIPSLGAVGAAIALVISHAIYTFSCVYIIHQELIIRTQYIIQQLILIIVITVFMSTIVYFLLDFVTGWITLFLVIVAGFTIWFIGSTVTGLIEPRKHLSILVN